MQLIQGGGNIQAQFVQPRLVDHAVLGDGEDGERLLHRRADACGGHLLPGGQAIDLAVLLGDSRPDLRVLLQDGAQVGHDIRGEVGGQVKLKVPALSLLNAHVLAAVKFVLNLNGDQLDFFHDYFSFMISFRGLLQCPALPG